MRAVNAVRPAPALSVMGMNQRSKSGGASDLLRDWRHTRGSGGWMTGTVHFEVEGPVAVLTNDNPDKHNAFDDEMDAELFDAFGRIAADPAIRAVVWRGEGPSFSSGRDVGSI